MPILIPAIPQILQTQSFLPGIGMPMNGLVRVLSHFIDEEESLHPFPN
jgi:hypothetical protein